MMASQARRNSSLRKWSWSNRRKKHWSHIIRKKSNSRYLPLSRSSRKPTLSNLISPQGNDLVILVGVTKYNSPILFLYYSKMSDLMFWSEGWSKILSPKSNFATLVLASKTPTMPGMIRGSSFHTITLKLLKTWSLRIDPSAGSTGRLRMDSYLTPSSRAVTSTASYKYFMF